MGKLNKGVNQKAAAANDKKAAVEAQKAAKEAAERAKQEEQEWKNGANLRGMSKAQEAAAKADEAARKKQEKAALLAEEEAALGAGGKAKKVPTLSKKGKGKKNDLALLENALVGAADKKVKAKKAAEREKAEKQKALAKQQEEKNSKPLDPLMQNTQDLIAGTEDDIVGRAANVAQGTEGTASGIDGALQTLNVSAGPGTVPSAKALFKAFEERMLPEVKADYPGLKLSQYKDKVFQLWKKSPENPANQQPM